MLYKWGKLPSAACALCFHPAETQSHIQCLRPALKEAWILAHHNMAHRLWKDMEDSTNGWIIVTGQTVAGIQGLQAPSMVASAGETDRDLAGTQFPRNCVPYNIIEF